MPTPESYAIGDAIRPLVIVPSSRDLVMYSVAAGDYYEAHYDADYARAQGLPGVIVHGLLKLGYLARAVTEWAGPDAFVRSISGSYRGLDLINDPFRVEGEVVDLRSDPDARLLTVELRGISADGTVSTPGSAVVEVPNIRASRAQKTQDKD